jgi:hypothetical protein
MTAFFAALRWAELLVLLMVAVIGGFYQVVWNWIQPFEQSRGGPIGK